MEIDLKEIKGVNVISIGDTIDLYNVWELKDLFQEMFEKMKVKFIIDLSRINYMDSSGVGALIKTLIESKKHGGGLKLLRPSLSAKRILELTNLMRHFEVYEKEETAVRSFGAGYIND